MPPLHAGGAPDAPPDRPHGAATCTLADHTQAPRTPPAHGTDPTRAQSTSPGQPPGAAAAATVSRVGAQYRAHIQPSHTHFSPIQAVPAFPEGTPRPVRAPAPKGTPMDITLPQLQPCVVQAGQEGTRGHGDRGGGRGGDDHQAKRGAKRGGTGGGTEGKRGKVAGGRGGGQVLGTGIGTASSGRGAGTREGPGHEQRRTGPGAREGQRHGHRRGGGGHDKGHGQGGSRVGAHRSGVPGAGRGPRGKEGGGDAGHRGQRGRGAGAGGAGKGKGHHPQGKGSEAAQTEVQAVRCIPPGILQMPARHDHHQHPLPIYKIDPTLGAPGPPRSPPSSPAARQGHTATPPTSPPPRRVNCRQSRYGWLPPERRRTPVRSRLACLPPRWRRSRRQNRHDGQWEPRAPPMPGTTESGTGTQPGTP